MDKLDSREFVYIYSTYGSFGQHAAKVPLFVVGDKLLSPKEAIAAGIVAEKKEDQHSNKNYHFKRYYTLQKEVDGVVVVECYASSRHEYPKPPEVFGKVSVAGYDDVWVINSKWVVSKCAKGLWFGNGISTLEAYEESKKLEEKRQAEKLEIERKKQEAPQIKLTVTPNGILVTGDTFHHREAIKIAAKACGGYAKWNGQNWIVTGTQANFADKLRELLPSKASLTS
jgi:hypothetical protein